MTDQTTHRRVVIPHMQLKLSGVSPATARQVADALPGAVAAEMGRSDPPAHAPLTLDKATSGAVTQALAREVAARLRSGIAAKEEGQ